MSVQLRPTVSINKMDEMPLENWFKDFTTDIHQNPLFERFVDGLNSTQTDV